MPEINSSFLRNIGGIRIYSGANFLVPCKRRPEYAPFGCAFSVSIVHGRYFRFFRVFVFFFDFFFLLRTSRYLFCFVFFSHRMCRPCRLGETWWKKSSCVVRLAFSVVAVFVSLYYFVCFVSLLFFIFIFLFSSPLFTC